jgi:predicted type IV restriction endonuclease
MSEQQKIKSIKKQLDKFDVSGAKDKCSNEVNTNRLLIEPFFQILGYTILEDKDGSLQPEFDASYEKKGEKVDYAIRIKGKYQILIESKKANTNLSKHLRQLKIYFNNVPDAQLGILTNGTRFEFYVRDNKNLNTKPFFVFDCEDYDGGSVETLSLFHYPLEMKKVMEYAEDIYFMDGFDDAFVNELLEPSNDFLKAINNRMGKGNLNEKRKIKIRDLINSVSVKTALDELIVREAEKSNTGIITTDEELKIYHSIVTVLATDKNIDTSRISYIDKAKLFSVVADNRERGKTICTIHINSRGSFIKIENDKFEVTDIQSIVDIKKKLITSAKNILNL